MQGFQFQPCQALLAAILWVLDFLPYQRMGRPGPPVPGSWADSAGDIFCFEIKVAPQVSMILSEDPELAWNSLVSFWLAAFQLYYVLGAEIRKRENDFCEYSPSIFRSRSWFFSGSLEQERKKINMNDKKTSLFIGSVLILNWPYFDNIINDRLKKYKG